MKVAHLRGCGFAASGSPWPLMEYPSQDQLLESWAPSNLWALPHQCLPAGTWRRWLLSGDRGLGKTHAASMAAHSVAANSHLLSNGAIAVIGRTRATAVLDITDSPSGILATARAGFIPVWRPAAATLTWPNGVVGRVFGADAINEMRGHAVAFAIADEIGLWPDAAEAWETIEVTVRLGRAQIFMTTTDRPDWVCGLESRIGTVVTRATVDDNPYLSAELRRVLADRRLE
jgi:phage terminase large subunit-like protein